MKAKLLLIFMGTLPLRATTVAVQQKGEAGKAEMQMPRVQAPSPAAMERFRDAGMKAVSGHRLTAQEWAEVKQAYVALPALNRRVLAQKLQSLSFVDGIPGAGTGLTSYDAKTGSFEITLRASIMHETLTQFLTAKERRVFREDGTGTETTVTGKGVNALTYVLLHESSHVLDKSCSITQGGYADQIWLDDKTMTQQEEKIVPTTIFRSVGPIAAGKASKVYDALAHTPFVSLYATASRQEDFAETLSWYEIFKRHHGSLMIVVRNARQHKVRRWEPLRSAMVQQRFAGLQAMLASEEACQQMH